jgi:Response regulator containing a CheY-like receiver domain and an HTH DNA-binding domain
MKKRIIIADDHAIVRTGLQMLLYGTSDMTICDEAANSKELLDKLNCNGYDLVVLDISMPGKDGTDTLKEIKSGWPELPVVILTMNPDEVYALRMFRSGASAFINKETNPVKIIEVLRFVLSGKKYFTPQQAELLSNTLDNYEKGRQPGYEKLTDRELQILFMITSGKKNAEIAKKLTLSIHTVENHRSNILKKLSVSSNLELVRFAYQSGLVK